MTLQPLRFHPSTPWHARLLDTVKLGWANCRLRWQERAPDPIVVGAELIDQLRKGIAGERTTG